MTNIKPLGTYEIAKICHVTPPTINRWIKEGKLPFFTTGGGQYRVWACDLVVFLNKHNIPVPPALQEGEPLRVLIVDDEPEVRNLARRLIEQTYKDAEVDEASDGFDAGRKIANFRPTLIILDIRLPGVDGYKVCRMIRDDSNLKGAKILTISGYNMEESMKKSLEAGADDFLCKPFDNTELIDRISKLVGPGQRKGWKKSCNQWRKDE